ncbi:MAG: hypothetical protein J5I91_02600 [Bacteroidetes bacterium]|nr:hypothetical protein [Bacteroidota bacterium]
MWFKTAYRTLLLLCPFYISSCNKSCPYIKTVPIQQEMKDWCEFLPGSYWIYKDSISGLFDTISIYDIQNKILETTPEKSKCPVRKQQELYLNYTEDSIPNPSNYEFYGIYEDSNPEKPNGEIIFRKKAERTLYSTYMLFPIQEGKSKRYGSRSFFTIESIIPQLSVADTSFDSIVCTHDNFCYPASGEARFYHVKHFGVIKKVFYSQGTTEPSAIWELVEWNVLQKD